MNCKEELIMTAERVNELKNNMKSFSKTTYQKSELLDEMFALQKEIVSLAFNNGHASLAELRILDVEKHLEQLNKELGNVADKELQRFVEESKCFCNLIKAEISGNKGEAKVFKTLEYIKSKNHVLKNVELSNGGLRTELDAVVITPSAISIVEVKNTSRDIFIDDAGNYFRTGEFLKYDCNIGEKMQVKEKLLRKALSSIGYSDVEINNVVVFTNSHIEVHNKYKGISTCFSCQLPYKLEAKKTEDIFTSEDMDNIRTCIEASDKKEAYSFEFDVEQYKTDFANLMAKLEDAAAKSFDVDEKFEEPTITTMAELRTCVVETVKYILTSKCSRYTGRALASLAISAMVGNITANVIHKVGC